MRWLFYGFLILLLIASAIGQTQDIEISRLNITQNNDTVLVFFTTNVLCRVEAEYCSDSYYDQVSHGYTMGHALPLLFTGNETWYNIKMTITSLFGKQKQHEFCIEKRHSM